MNLQHRNQAPRPQNRHRFDFEGKSLKKPEAPGSAGRCEKGTGRSTAPSLCPAVISHPLYWLYSGIFQPCPHRAEFGFLGPGAGPFPTLDAKPAHRAKRWPTGGFPVQAAAGHEKDCCLGFPGSGPVSLLWGLLEIFRFFLILRPEEVFLPQVIRLLLGDLPAPLAGIDGAVELVP